MANEPTTPDAVVLDAREAVTRLVATSGHPHDEEVRQWEVAILAALPRAEASEVVAWAVYNGFGSVDAVYGIKERADEDAAKWNANCDKHWVAARPFVVRPLYASPTPLSVDREKVEKALDAYTEEAYRRYEFGSRFDASEFYRLRAALLALIFPTPDRTGGTENG